MLHQAVLPFATHHTRRFCGVNAADPARAEGLLPVTTILGDTPAGDDPAPVSAHAPSSRRMPSESLDAPENLPKAGPRQVTFSQLKDEPPRMPNQAVASLEEPLPQARQRPALDDLPRGPGPCRSFVLYHRVV